MMFSDNTEMIGGVVFENCFYPHKNLPSGTIRLILSSVCNFNCKFCFSEGEDKKKRILPLSYVKKVLKISKEFGIKNVKLSGGEPLLYPNLEKLLFFIKNENFSYLDITTNVSLLDSNKINLFNKYSVNALTFSLSAFTDERYLKITGKNKFNTVLNNIMNAKRNFKGRIRINCVVFDEDFSLDEYKKIIQFCIDNSFGLRLVEPTTVKGLSITHSHSSFYKVKEYLKDTYNSPLLSKCKSVEYYFYDEKKYITIMNSLCDNKLCDSCRDYMYIRLSSEGRLKPCLLRKDTEVNVPFDASDKLIRDAFTRAIHNVGNGISDRNVFPGLENPYKL